MTRSHLTHARRLARRGCFALRPLSAAALLSLSAGAMADGALPSAGNVVYGTVTTTQPNANTLNIHQGSDKAYVQYDSFSIGVGNKVTIQQPTATSTFLGQVTGYDPSFILGQLQANGRVFLVNPNGIVFGEHARVDVGALIATTMSLSLGDFLNNRILLTSNPTDGRGELAGVVKNEGTITAAEGGFVVLAGRDVVNSGQILVEKGRAGMAAASKLLIDVEGDGLLFFQVEGKDANARLAQLGRIEANGGSVELMAASRSQFADTVLNMSGVVQARGLGTKQGRVVIDGGSRGITDVSGTVDTTGAEVGQKGGDITVTGDRVLVRDTAVLDASGAAGGGRLLVGGDFHGANADVRNAKVTVVGSGARLRANAQQSGDGGDVVVWADDTTRFHGGIEAKGGTQGGNGGKVEVSGKVSLAYQGLVDASAPKGKVGTLLLDPRDVSITANGAALNWTAAAGVAAPADAEVNVASINAAVADVTLTADRDATVDAAINIANAGTGLSISAGRDLTVTQSVTTNNGAVQLSAGTGAIKLNNDVNAGTGNVTLTGGVTLGGAGGTRSLTGGAVSVGAVTGGGNNLTVTAGTSATLGGAVTGVGTLDAAGSATTAINADVTTTAGQSYGAVTLGGAGATRTLSGTTVSLGAVTGNAKNLTVTGSTSATLGGAVIGVGTLDASGSATTAINANVTTTAGQSYGAATVGGAGTTRTLTGTTVALGALDGGGKNLTLAASTSATLGGAVGNVNTLDASGAAATSVGANVSTTAGQTYGGTVTLTGASTFTGSSVGFNNLAAAANNLGIHADAITVAGAATGTGTLNLAPTADAGSIGVNSATASTLSINDALLAKFSGFSTLIIGTSTGTGNIAFGNTTLPFNTLVRSASGNVDFAQLNGAHSLGVQTTGTISLNDLVGGTTALSSLDLNGPVTVGTTLVKTSGDQTYGGTLTLAANGVSIEAGPGKISLTSVDGGGANDLTLKSANAAADAIKTTGAIGNIRMVDVQGKSTLGGNVTSTGNQTYGDTATLAANVTLDAGAAKVSLVDVAGATHDLTLKSTNAAADAIKTTGAVGGVVALNVQGRSTLGANVTSTGAQDYTGAVTLGGAVTLNSNGANVRLRDKVDGAQAFAVNAGAGTARFDGAVGGTMALTSLGVTASTVDVNGGGVTTTGAQTYTASSVNLGAATTFTTSGLTVNGTLAAGANDLSVFADALNVTGSITSTGAGAASIAARQAATTIGVAGGAGTFQVTSALLNKFASFGSVTVGRADGVGAITFGNMTGGSALNRSLNVRNGSGNVTFGQIDTTLDGAYDLDVATTTGTVFLNGDMGNSGRLNKLTVDGPTTLGAGFIYTAGAQQYKDAVTLNNDVALIGSGVTFDGTVSGATRDLGVQANSGAERVRFLGDVNVRSVLVYGGADVGADITTSQGQTYNGAVSLSDAATFTGLSLTFNNNLAAGAHNLGLLADTFSVSGALSGTGVAQIGAYTASRNTVVGASGNVGDLVVDASTFSQFSSFSGLTVGRADGTGSITLGTNGGSFSLPTNLTLLNGSGDISVLSTISGARSLALNTSGTTTIGANLSGLTSLSTDAGGTTRLGASVGTSGTQTYGDAVVLDNSTSLSASTVNFGNTVNAGSAGGQSLGITGNARFAQAVGGSQALSNVSVSGTTQFDHGGVSSTSSQIYSGAVTLGDDSHFNASNAFVRFENTVTGPHALSTNTSTGTVFFNTVNVASVNIAAGLSYLYGGNVTTTGAQTYAGNSLLGANNTLNATNVGFGGTVDGNQSLTINASGTTTLNGALGASTALASLSTSGATSLNGGSVRTNGAQSYGGAVTLGANTTITANTVDFNGTVDGARTLTVNDSGTTTFHGNVGGTNALTSLTTAAGGSTVLPAQVTTIGAQTYGDPVTLAANTTLSANSVSLANLIGASHALSIATPGLVDFNGTLTGLTSLTKTGAGTTRFIGAGGLTTSGAQSYAGDVQVLSGTATFDGSALTFSGDLTGANNLSLAGDTVSVVGDITGTGTFAIAPKSTGTTIGLSGGAGALQVDLNKVSGFTQRVIGRTDGTGAINVGASNLTAGTTVQSGSGNITFGTLTGAHALAANTAGVTTFGDVTGLTSLSTDAAGSTQLAGDSTLSATTSLVFNDAVSYSGNVSLTAPALSLGAGASGGTNLTLSTNTLSLGGALAGSGELTLQPTGAGTSIGLAGGVGTLQITQATLNQVSGFTSQTIGRTDGTAAINANALTLARDTKVQSASGTVTFGGTVDGARALTVNTTGTTNFNGDVGGTTALTSLTTNAGGGTNVNASQVRATNALTFGDAVTYTGSTTFSAANQQFAGGVSGGSNLTLVANTLASGGPVSGSGILSILPLSVTSIGLAGAAGDLQITQALLNQTSGFTQRVIGRSTGAVDILSGALTLNGDTTLQSGTGGVHFQSTVDGAHTLTVNTAGETRFQGDVGTTTALTSITTDAPGTTRIDASAMRTTGAQTYNDPVTATGILSLVASTVSLHAASDLDLGVVNLSQGGNIGTDGVLTLTDSLTLGGGTLVLSAGEGAGAGIAFTDPELAARPGLISGSRSLREAAAAIKQTGGLITTAAGSTLDLQAANRGSILIDHTTNEIGGNLKAVSGPAGDADASRFAGSGVLPLSFVRVNANQLHAAGIEADAVKLTANSLSTAAGTNIRARLPYINAQGIESSVAALTLVLRQPNVLNQFGTQASSSWIQVDVGNSQGGFLTVRPKGAGAGSSAVYLGGSDANVPFYDGTSKASEIQVYFNGRVPSTPQEVGALSAVTAVIEESRRARFDEAVRTENVSSRLRTGVIAEVGSGRPATEGSESIRMPATCTPTATLGCQ